MKRILLFILGMSSIAFLQAQVGVNTYDPKVSLDVQAASTDASTAEGLIAPRLTLAQLASKEAKYLSDQTGTIVYVTNVTGTTTAKTKNVISVGYYYFDGTLWQSVGPDKGMRFFYMPSIVLPTDTSDPSYNSATETFTIDIHKSYAEQFQMTNVLTSIKSLGSTALPLLANNALEYFITYYDNTVFQNVEMSDLGVLKYKLPALLTVTDKTFMNIVFKVK
ncbi:hypothetical protein CLV62_11855 [Dysgonomonas alginatilytica]|uniref:Uncharacterized protein n=1 Tax=Dysgonomonas alginatilytica TaxID=1605892 RepID=A0A2V3PPD7_9BACT|nr:hypothetical protein [Dysgonomonas alginatilytica]PXV62666.1 hypothetical protein CLV62_11855 [Dysgonomonas alginatilytica]